MEIFKVASQQMQDTVAMSQATQKVQNREVEHTQIQQNVAQEDKMQVTSEELDKAIEKLNENMGRLETNIRFGYNDKINAMFVNVMRKDNGEIIRKIPSEHVIKLAENFREIVGTLFDAKE